MSVIEIAVFSAREGLSPVWPDAHRRLAQIPGHQRSLRLSAVKEPTLRADLVVWAGLAEAQAAAAEVESNPDFQPFVSQIETVRHYAHYLTENPSGLVSSLERAPVIEVALYPVSKEQLSVHRSLHGPIHDRLETMDGVIAHALLAQCENDGVFGDLIGWQDSTVFEETGQKLMADPELAPFFTAVSTPEVFTLFEVVR